MTALRSLLYQIIFISLTLIECTLFLPLLLGGRRTMQKAATFWLSGALLLQRLILGLRVDVRGRENLPAGPVIIAAKHQSAWDTMIFHQILADPAYILKQELLSLPFIGWYLRKTGMVAIDRKAGMKALKLMVSGAQGAVADQRQVVIFPEGHRQDPGTTGEYHAGVAMLYGSLGVPVVPVALNSGMFWGRNAFLRHPGVVTLQILPPIAPGSLDRKSFMGVLQTQIETATRALEAEALQRYPYLPRLTARADG